MSQKEVVKSEKPDVCTPRSSDVRASGHGHGVTAVDGVLDCSGVAVGCPEGSSVGGGSSVTGGSIGSDAVAVGEISGSAEALICSEGDTSTGLFVGLVDALDAGVVRTGIA